MCVGGDVGVVVVSVVLVMLMLLVVSALIALIFTRHKSVTRAVISCTR